MAKPTPSTVELYDCSEHIYVKADGRTVCGATDKDVAFQVYTKGDRLTKAQFDALIFPDAGKPEPLPDAEQRSAELGDADKRGGKKK